MDINTATLEINRILQQLEQSTGSIVEELSLHRLDVTSFGDTRQVLQTTVVIELKRMPAQNWSV
jgi:hypothetical protein